MEIKYKAPFPYFGGKSAIADVVWDRFGDTPNFVEPFFGSGAVLLNCPYWTPDKPRLETVNDLSGFIANFWRSVRADPDAVAHHADWIVSESDLHARHAWLISQSVDLSAKMEGDPDFYDPKIAGWWVWGAACWIGSGWCSGRGPWSRQETDGGWRLVKKENGKGIKRQIVCLNHHGQGINQDAVSRATGANAGTGEQGLCAWMRSISKRLARVRVCCGDWSRVCGPTPTYKNGLTAIFLDPPYTADAGRDNNLYEKESATVGHDVAAWCKENGDNPMLRIAICGYDGEYDMPGWDCVSWKASGGYGSQSNGTGRENANRERIWFSPHCLKPKAEYKTLSLFES